MKIDQTRSMEDRLAGVGRHIDALLHKTSEVNGLSASARAELDTWKRWRDELALHAHLGLMDAREAAMPLLDRIEGTIGSIVHGMDDPSDVIDAEELGDRLTDELPGLRRELEAAGADFRIT